MLKTVKRRQILIALPMETGPKDRDFLRRVARILTKREGRCVRIGEVINRGAKLLLKESKK